jgi:hypothetical protein
MDIVGFRSRCIRITKERGKRSHEAGYGPHHAAKMWDRMVGPIFPLVAFHVDFFRHLMCFLKKMMCQKDWISLTSRRLLKLKNMQKQEVLFCRVKTKIKRII